MEGSRKIKRRGGCWGGGTVEARESGKQADRVTTVYSYMGRQTRYTDIHKVQTRLTHTE